MNAFRRAIVCLIAILVVVGATALARADDNDARHCTAELGQSGIAYKACLNQARGTLEKQLTTSWAELAREIRRLDADDGGTRLSVFEKSADHWSAYRDTACQSVFSFHASGSDASAALIRCQIQLLTQRLSSLKDLY